MLTQEDAQAKEGSSQQLRLRLAILPVDPEQVNYLYERLLDAAPNEFPVLRDALASHKDELVEKLWAVAGDSTHGEQHRLRAAAALASYDPGSQKWEKVAVPAVNALIGVPAEHLTQWLNAYRPVCRKLSSPLGVVFRDAKRSETEHSRASDILADYTAGQPELLANLVMDAEANQFSAVFRKLKKHQAVGVALLQEELGKQTPPDTKEEAVDELARRQANAAVALLQMNQPERVWPLLKSSSNPTMRSYLIHRLAPLGTKADVIVKQLHEERDLTIQRALILSLGEFDADSSVDKDAMIAMLLEKYRVASDAGLHGASEWLLRRWRQEDRVVAIDGQLKKDECRIASIRMHLAYFPQVRRGISWRFRWAVQ